MKGATVAAAALAAAIGCADAFVPSAGLASSSMKPQLRAVQSGRISAGPALTQVKMGFFDNFAKVWLPRLSLFGIVCHILQHLADGIVQYCQHIDTHPVAQSSVLGPNSDGRAIVH